MEAVHDTTSSRRDAPRIIAAALLLLVVFSTQSIHAQPAPPKRNFESNAAVLVTPETQKSIDRGLAYLAVRQHPDGSFGSGTT